MLLTMPHYSGIARRRPLPRRARHPGHGEKLAIACSPRRAGRVTRPRFVRCPPVTSTDRSSWLGFWISGSREPGHVLYPTCDSIAWLFAANEAALRKHFLLYQPPLATMVQVLNKKRLWQACLAAGIDTVPTYFPDDESEVQVLAETIPLPVLIKARTHVLRFRQTKGIVVRTRDALLPSYRRYLENDRYHPGHERDFVDATRPLLQRFYAEAAEAVALNHRLHRSHR